MRLALSVLLLVMTGCTDPVHRMIETTSPPPTTGCLSLMIVSPASATLAIGDTVRIHASAGCSPTPFTQFTWRVSDTTVAAVDNGGLVRGVGKGTATVIASAVQSPNVQGASAITVVTK